MKKILGIDQSLTNTGVCLFNDVDETYHQHLKNYIIKMKNIIDIFQKKPTSLIELGKKNQLKSFNLHKFIDNSKHTNKDKEELKKLLDEIFDLQKWFKSNYQNFSEQINNLQQSKNKININHKLMLISSKEKNIGRLIDYRNKIIYFMKDNPVEIVGIEGYSYGSKSTRSLFELGELGGILKTSIIENNNILIIIPPSTLKKFILKGNRDKNEIFEKCLINFDLNFENINKTDDIIDAFLISLFIFHFPFLNIYEQLKCKIVI